MKKIIFFLAAFSMSTLGRIASVSAQSKTPADAEKGAKVLKPMINLEELFDLNSNVWNAYPDNDKYNFVRSEEKYVVAATRADGVVALVNQQESYMTPGKMVLRGTYFKCGKMIDTTFSVEDAEALALEFANPAIDDSERIRGFEADMPIHDLYLVACP